jgi:hypothetical protein
MISDFLTFENSLRDVVGKVIASPGAIQKDEKANLILAGSTEAAHVLGVVADVPGR